MQSCRDSRCLSGAFPAKAKVPPAKPPVTAAPKAALKPATEPAAPTAVEKEDGGDLVSPGLNPKATTGAALMQTPRVGKKLRVWDAAMQHWQDGVVTEEKGLDRVRVEYLGAATAAGDRESEVLELGDEKVEWLEDSPGSSLGGELAAAAEGAPSPAAASGAKVSGGEKKKRPVVADSESEAEFGLSDSDDDAKKMPKGGVGGRTARVSKAKPPAKKKKSEESCDDESATSGSESSEFDVSSDDVSPSDDSDGDDGFLATDDDEEDSGSKKKKASAAKKRPAPKAKTGGGGAGSVPKRPALKPPSSASTPAAKRSLSSSSALSPASPASGDGDVALGSSAGGALMRSTYSHDALSWYVDPAHIKDAKGVPLGAPGHDKRTLLVPEDFMLKQSPGQAQWWDMKRRARDCVIFFKVQGLVG